MIIFLLLFSTIHLYASSTEEGAFSHYQLLLSSPDQLQEQTLTKVEEQHRPPQLSQKTLHNLLGAYAGSHMYMQHEFQDHCKAYTHKLQRTPSSFYDILVAIKPQCREILRNHLPRTAWSHHLSNLLEYLNYFYISENQTCANHKKLILICQMVQYALQRGTSACPKIKDLEQPTPPSAANFLNALRKVDPLLDREILLALAYPQPCLAVIHTHDINNISPLAHLLSRSLNRYILPFPVSLEDLPSFGHPQNKQSGCAFIFYTCMLSIHAKFEYDITLEIIQKGFAHYLHNAIVQCIQKNWEYDGPLWLLASFRKGEWPSQRTIRTFSQTMLAESTSRFLDHTLSNDTLRNFSQSLEESVASFLAKDPHSYTTTNSMILAQWHVHIDTADGCQPHHIKNLLLTFMHKLDQQYNLDVSNHTLDILLSKSPPQKHLNVIFASHIPAFILIQGDTGIFINLPNPKVKPLGAFSTAEKFCFLDRLITLCTFIYPHNPLTSFYPFNVQGFQRMCHKNVPAACRKTHLKPNFDHASQYARLHGMQHLRSKQQKITPSPTTPQKHLVCDSRFIPTATHRQKIRTKNIRPQAQSFPVHGTRPLMLRSSDEL